jgi:hypothetical protein
LLTVTELVEPFGINQGDLPADGSSSAVCVGPIVDLGPEGIAFKEPVAVTISYDENRLPQGFAESEVAVAYWNGRAWVGVRGAVDTEKNTVTFRLKEFKGLIGTTIAGVVIVGSVIIGEGIYLWHKWGSGETVTSDPISQGKAAEWVTPNDRTVRDWANRAVFVDEAGSHEQLAVDDPAVAEWTKGGRSFSVAFKQPDGTLLSLKGRYSSAAGANWQKPADYFTTGDVRGDCTDVTNGVVSVLRNRGYRAKGVFGYAGDKDTPHVWGETIIGGEPFLIDEDGILWPLEKGLEALKLLRAESDDKRNAMWDEARQEPYQPEWWLRSPEESTSTTASQEESTSTTAGSGPLTVPTEPGYVVASSTQVTKAADPQDRRLFVTSTNSYDDDNGRSRVSVGVFEYVFVDGKLSNTPSRRIFSYDTPVGGENGGLGEALALAAEATTKVIEEEGLVEGWPVS